MEGFIGLLFLILCFWGICKCISSVAKQNEKKRERLAQHNASLSSPAKHISGLPLPSGVAVNVFYGSDKIVIEKDSQEFVIMMNKVTSIDNVSGRDINTNTASGAAAGFLVAGVAGAIVGSLISTSLYLVISYTSNSEDKQIVLDASDGGFFSTKVEKAYKQRNAQSETTIEL